MEKLELKHLAGYLPYGLRIYYWTEKESLIRPLTLSKVEIVLRGESEHSYNKPILRPLSDLTKEIEVEGEKFVPIKWFDENISPINCSVE